MLMFEFRLSKRQLKNNHYILSSFNQYYNKNTHTKATTLTVGTAFDVSRYIQAQVENLDMQRNRAADDAGPVVSISTDIAVNIFFYF